MESPLVASCDRLDTRRVLDRMVLTVELRRSAMVTIAVYASQKAIVLSRQSLKRMNGAAVSADGACAAVRGKEAKNWRLGLSGDG